MNLTPKKLACLLTLMIITASWPRDAAAAEPADPPAADSKLPKFPVHPPADPERVNSGRGLFSVNCSFCHGATAKGGESGPSLVRSAIVLDDKNGELIEPIVHKGIPGKGMPNFSLSTEQIGDIAAFIHSIPVGEGSLSAPVVVDSLVGDPKAGAAYFNGAAKCSTCHSITGDLAHIGSKRKPRDLQSAMVAGRRREAGLSSYFALPLFIPPGTTARITLPSGSVYSGTLQFVDEFNVTIMDSVTGNSLTFVRDGATPTVQIHDPIQAHLDLLRVYTDDDIHNLTAYLATLK
jgi:cytochrome c oxidase cbb3-type subunit III